METSFITSSVSTASSDPTPHSEQGGWISNSVAAVTNAFWSAIEYVPIPTVSSQQTASEESVQEPINFQGNFEDFSEDAVDENEPVLLATSPSEEESLETVMRLHHQGSIDDATFAKKIAKLYLIDALNTGVSSIKQRINRIWGYISFQRS